MTQRLKTWFVERLAWNLKAPEDGFFGWLSARAMLRNNSFLEKNAVNLCNIKPDHKVLEIGFGPGVGLEEAFNIVRGNGKVYGIDTSFYMVDKAGQRLRHAVQAKKVMLFHGSATQIPLNTDSVDKVFHSNCYYFWPSMRSVLREVYRVMKPGSVMVTTLNLDRLQESQKAGFLQHGNPDPVRYMTCLENYGFEGVRLEYLNDTSTGKPFQVIYAEVREKAAHDRSMLSDDEEDDLEREELLLKDKAQYDELLQRQFPGTLQNS